MSINFRHIPQLKPSVHPAFSNLMTTARSTFYYKSHTFFPCSREIKHPNWRWAGVLTPPPARLPPPPSLRMRVLLALTEGEPRTLYALVTATPCGILPRLASKPKAGPSGRDISGLKTPTAKGRFGTLFLSHISRDVFRSPTCKAENRKGNLR